jgi:ribonuclease Z
MATTTTYPTNRNGIMNNYDKTDSSTGISRREALKLSGLALGGLAGGGSLFDLVARAAHAADTCESDCDCPEGPSCRWDVKARAQNYTYFDRLPAFSPFSRETATTIPRLGKDEMRITFMGSAVPPRTLAQRMMSIFVEVGWDEAAQMPVDQFVFDCGSGVCANYGAMNVGFGRMTKIFLTHLHGDHMSDLVHIYCFGPSGDRKSPQFVWGPGPSGLRNPDYDPTDETHGPEFYDDGTRAFCEHLRETCRWHSESFSFQTTSYTLYQPPTQTDWGLPHEPARSATTRIGTPMP